MSDEYEADDFDKPIGRAESVTPLVDRSGILLAIQLRPQGASPSSPLLLEGVRVSPDVAHELSEELRKAVAEWDETYGQRPRVRR